MITHDYTQAQICCLQELKSYDANSEARSLTHKGDLYTGAILRQQCSGIAESLVTGEMKRGAVIRQNIMFFSSFDLTPEIVC